MKLHTASPLAAAQILTLTLTLTQVTRDLVELDQAMGRLSAELPCEDEDLRCGLWEAAGECHNNSSWMLKHCLRACTPCAAGRA